MGHEPVRGGEVGKMVELQTNLFRNLTERENYRSAAGGECRIKGRE